MLFKEKGNKGKPTILLLHGGGLSDWSLEKVSNFLEEEYHVVLAIIDGHGENGASEFISIENSADKVINYINTHCGGSIHAICGLSIGAQIVCEVLAREKSIAGYAVIESALVYPMEFVTALTVPTYQVAYGLIQKRWFSKMQAQTLCVPEYLFETYYQDSLKITKQSLINITKSNGSYALKPSISDTDATVLVIAGEKEISIMKKSAKHIHKTIQGSTLLIASDLKHGEFSLVHSGEYVKAIYALFQK